MEQYLQKTYVAGILNRIGLNLLVVTACATWFVFLWGFRASALVAGIALGCLVIFAVRLYNKRTVNLREEELRRRIGGELAVEKLLLADKRQAHFQAALWLGLSHPLKMQKSMNDGLLCTLDERRLLIHCIPRHESEKIACSDLVRVQKAVVLSKAEKGVVCVTAGLTDAAKQYVENAVPRLVIIDKKELVRFAGIMMPATNEQLVQLGQSKRRKGSKKMWTRHVLSAHRSKRYLLYGCGLMALYFITKLPYYPVPGVILICLSFLSRLYKQKSKPL